MGGWNAVDEGAGVGGIELRMTLSDGRALRYPEGTIDIVRENRDTQPDDRVGMALMQGPVRTAQGATYRFAVVEEDRQRAVDLWDRTGPQREYRPSLSFCTTMERRTKPSITYSLYRSGFGSTKSQSLSADSLHGMMAKIRPCPTP
ncbi:hypothetical protein [Falsirhodobacter sp. 1013]|uniref:hypothetical protein n=1 Tax=Falsirhodobacter sp. 1013 TaxID=3417566 RepID=UPI003EC02C3C